MNWPRASPNPSHAGKRYDAGVIGTPAAERMEVILRTGSTVPACAHASVPVSLHRARSLVANRTDRL